MSTETQERTDADVDDVAKIEWATKADVDAVLTKVSEQGVEVGKTHTTLKWIAWILGGLFLMVAALVFLLLAIALRL